MPIFTIFSAHLFSELLKKKKILGTGLLALSITPSLIVTTLLIFSPIKYFNLLDSISHHSQKKDYVTYWSSGYGFDEVKKYLEKVSKKQPVVAGVRLDAGIPENAVFTYFAGSKQVFPTYLDSRIIKDFETYECLNSKVPVYFISRDNHLAGLNKHLVEIKRVYKPERKHYIGIHKLRKDCQGKTLNLF